MRPLRGITYKLISVLVFIAMASLIKLASDHVPPGEAVFFRSFFAIPVILGWLWLRGDLKNGVKTSRPGSHFFRALAGTASMALQFAALGMLPLPEVTAIIYAAPLMVVVLAAMVLKEKVGPWRYSAVGLGLAGVLIILAPRFSLSEGLSSAQSLGAAIALAAAVFMAFAQISIRRLTGFEPASTIVFWFTINATLLSLLSLPFGWVMPPPEIFAILVLAGFLGGIGQILLTSSYREAEAAVIAPLDYASMIFALAIGWFFFSEVPTLPMLGGAALVMAAGVLIIWREHKLGKDRSKARKASTQGG
ncbi:DMT family transporter [Falsigemmobacter faecalis]|uniref:DMT family transporter n=1 Tax=Falsigemmobacter faecalis TaxID=2488730 RepID=A0A3P3E043_9RHOB|nr:DMT family transporter [Falsigemmobacter faecalis]RRH78438.1 DMT family transporter [Falsigemmobacter faecalis]